MLVQNNLDASGWSGMPLITGVLVVLGNAKQVENTVQLLSIAHGSAK